MKEFSYHQPYGKRNAYTEEIKNADLMKIAKLIKIVGVLLQSKAYLFWQT